jgi:site-specific DNA recombinase
MPVNSKTRRQELVLRIAIYCRVSSEDQTERRTVDNQIDFLRRYAELHGLEVADAYVDDGVSGTVPLQERAGGARLLADADAGRFQRVVVYRLDRLGRSLRVLLDAYHRLDGLDVALVSATEPFDTTSPIGRFVFQLLGSIAELEKETIVERMTLGRDRVARAGKWMGGPVPYGYSVTGDGDLVAGAEAITTLDGRPASEADVVRFVFAELVRGSSTIATAALLNSLGVPAHYKYHNREGKVTKRKAENRWRPNKVRNIVANPVYAGRHTFSGRGGEPIERAVPALVDAETWQRANAQLHRNRALARRNARRTYLLRGLVRCAGCGLGFAGTPATSGDWVGFYYRCNAQTGAQRPNREARCRAKRIRADWLEATVWGDVEDFLRAPSETMDRARAALRAPAPTRDRVAATAEVDAALRANAASRERVIDLYRRGRIRLEELEGQLAAVEAEERVLRDSLAAVEAEGAHDEAVATYLDDLEATLRIAGEKLDAIAADEASGDAARVGRARAARRDLVDLLVERVLVTTTGEGRRRDATVRVDFRFKCAVEVSTGTSVHIHDTGSRSS